LNGEPLPENVDGLYIGGGFPEEFAQDLSQQFEVKRSIYHAIECGLPTFAECGGFMFLTEMLETTDCKQYEMTGIIPGTVKMQTRLAALGYREIKGMNSNFLIDDRMVAKGHEFHYSTYHPTEEIQPAYVVKTCTDLKQEGYMKENIVAGYTHFHFGSCPQMAENWIKKCLEFKSSMK
jgi:cobyrinic acid a,c-diamide synthase